MALFRAGLKLDRALTRRAWGSTARLLLIAMPITIGLVALLGSLLLGLSAGAALLLGACLAPTDPVLAGDIGVGPPGDEDEHEPNFALTVRGRAQRRARVPVRARGAVHGRRGRDRLDRRVARRRRRLRRSSSASRSAPAAGLAAAWSVKRLRDAELLAPALDGYHAIATVLVIYGLAEVAGAYGFLAAFAGGLAFRRYEHDHEVNASVHEGAELSEKLLELAVILLLGSMLTLSGLEAPGWEGWLLALLVLVAIRPLACLRRARGLASSTTRPRRRSSPGSASAASARCSTSRSPSRPACSLPASATWSSGR